MAVTQFGGLTVWALSPPALRPPTCRWVLGLSPPPPPRPPRQENRGRQMRPWGEGQTPTEVQRAPGCLSRFSGDLGQCRCPDRGVGAPGHHCRLTESGVGRLGTGPLKCCSRPLWRMVTRGFVWLVGFRDRLVFGLSHLWVGGNNTHTEVASLLAGVTSLPCVTTPGPSAHTWVPGGPPQSAPQGGDRRAGHAGRAAGSWRNGTSFCP